MHKLLNFDETQLSFFVIHAFDVLRIHCQIQSHKIYYMLSFEISSFSLKFSVSFLRENILFKMFTFIIYWYVCRCTCAIMCMWNTEDNLLDLVLSSLYRV